MDTEWIPKGAIVTPNIREYEMLFGKEILRQAQDDKADENTVSALSNVKDMAEKYDCTIVLKGPETIVCSSGECSLVEGGNAGLTKGGTGDVLAGLTTSLFAKNDALLSACAASFIEKRVADELYKNVGTDFNAEDLANKIPSTIASLMK